MKIEEVIQILDKAVGSSAGKPEARLKQRFSNILHELKYKDFTVEQQRYLEKELDVLFSSLDLNAPNVDKDLRKRLKLFIKLLRTEFSILPEGYCANYGMFAGIIAGSFLLVILLIYTESSLKFYAPLGGLILGMLIGSVCDMQVKKKGRTLLTKMY